MDRTKHKWGHWEPGGERGEVDELVVYTEKEILDMYWDFWYAQMVRKYGQGHYLITEQNCIDDWVVTHYATELK
jgi:hypothetical protein